MCFSSCVLCLTNRNKTPGISLHQFPNEPLIRLKWLDAHGFTETDIANIIVKYVHHILVQYATKKGSKCLKSGSIPTRCIKKVLVEHSQPSTSSTQISLNKDLLNERESTIETLK